MTREDADYSEHSGPVVGFEYPREDDGPREAIDRYREAIGLFSYEIMRHYKPRVAMIKLAALRHLTDLEKEPVTAVAADLGVSRQFFNRVKAAVGVSLRGLLCKSA